MRALSIGHDLAQGGQDVVVFRRRYCSRVKNEVVALDSPHNGWRRRTEPAAHLFQHLAGPFDGEDSRRYVLAGKAAPADGGEAIDDPRPFADGPGPSPRPTIQVFDGGRYHAPQGELVGVGILYLGALTVVQ